MTALHSSLFTLESGQSGLEIYTSQRDAAAAARVGPMTWCASGVGRRRWAEALHVSKREAKVPTCPEEGWLSNGQRVLHFKPVIWDRWHQSLEVTIGQVLPDGSPPLLQRRARLSREQAVALWRERIAEGWKPCAPQWHAPQPLQWPA